jgi:fructose-specific phosphotransferase system IIC component
MAPPPSPGGTDFQRPNAGKQPAWPKVIGILSVIFASLGLVCGVLNVVITASGFNETMSSFSDEQSREFQESVKEQTGSIEAFGSVAGLVIAGILLAAGITLLKRRRQLSRKLHLLYAIAAILVNVITGVLMLLVLLNLEAPEDNQQAQIMKATMLPGVLLGSLFGLAYPVFTLVWFLRGKIARQCRGEGDQPLDPNQPAMPMD